MNMLQFFGKFCLWYPAERVFQFISYDYSMEIPDMLHLFCFID